VPLDQSAHIARIISSLLISHHFLVKKQVTISKSALEACHKAEAIVIATEWREFKEIDWRQVYSHMNKPAFLFDGRLLVDAEKLREIGFKVSSTPIK
jgi:UDPglucose 6-dehydrogenase